MLMTYGKTIVCQEKREQIPEKLEVSLCLEQITATSRTRQTTIIRIHRIRRTHRIHRVLTAQTTAIPITIRRIARTAQTTAAIITTSNLCWHGKGRA